MDDPSLPPPPAPPERPQLRRSRSDRVIAGVAGGIARHLGLDATLVRLAWVAVALLGGGGVILYLVAWLIIAEEPADGTASASTAASSGGDGSIAAYIIGGILIALGAIWLVGPISGVFFRYLVPAVLIGVGIMIIAGSSRR